MALNTLRSGLRRMQRLRQGNMTANFAKLTSSNNYRRAFATDEELAKEIESFRAEMETVKGQVKASDFPWYPYGSLNNFGMIDATVPGGWPALKSQIVGTRIVDIGAADGETSFFLERCGISVDVIDHSPTNFNQMRGLTALKEGFQSEVNIYDIDLDQQFRLPTNYEFALFLGTLYHIKNPYYILEALARNVRSILLSTRVCTHDKVGGTSIKDIPAAYLVDPLETNNDATNFWMFTHAGLKRILNRTGWEVRAFETFGSVNHSDPASAENDERAFVYAVSRW